MKTSRVDAEPVRIQIDVSMLCVLHLAARISKPKVWNSNNGGKKEQQIQSHLLGSPHVATQTLEIPV